MLSVKAGAVTTDRRGQAWLPEEEERLRQGYLAGVSVVELRTQLGRSRSGIRARLRKLGIDPDEGLPRPTDGSPAPMSDQPLVMDVDLEKALAGLDISVRLRRAIANSGAATLDQLRALTDRDFLDQASIGRRTLGEWQAIRPALFPDDAAPPGRRSARPAEEWGALAPYGIVLDTAYRAFKTALLAANDGDGGEAVSRAAAALTEVIAHNPVAPLGREAADGAAIPRSDDGASGEQLIELIVEMIQSNPRLDDRDRLIIQARLGLENELGAGPATLEEIGRRLEVTRERVRQLEIRAFRRLSYQARREPWRTKLSLLATRVLSQFPLSAANHVAHMADWARFALGTGRMSLYVLGLWSVILDGVGSRQALERAGSSLREARSRAVDASRYEGDGHRLDADIVRWQSALADIVFPKNRQRFDAIPSDLRTRQREPLGLLGSAIEYDSVKAGRVALCESETEHRFYELLDRLPQVVAWSEQPVRIPFEKGGRDIGYVPDVVVLLDTGDLVVIEVKDMFGLVTTRARERARAAVRHLAGMGVSYLFCTADGLTFQKLKQRSVNTELVDLLTAEMMQTGTLRWKQVKPLIQATGASSIDLATAISASPWTFSTFPFRLQP